MKGVSLSRSARLSRLSPAILLGLGVIAAVRLLTLPHSLWEWDEILFVWGVEHFDPLHHRPHPPGYPLLIGLGKAFNVIFRDAFVSLVALNVLSCLVGYLALAAAYRRMALPAGAVSPESERSAEWAAVAGALLFHLSPTMLVYGPTALSDPSTLLFLSLALAAAARLPESASAWPALAFGACAAGAVGCRPQLAVSVLPMLAVGLWIAPAWRRRVEVLAAFTLVCLLWFVPLLVAVGGPSGLIAWLGKQAGLVAAYDTQIPRAGQSAWEIATRFIAHPWGMRWTSVPVLALALAGSAALLFRGRWKRLLPLVVLAAVELVFCLSVMNPRDAVRYALPSLLGVAFAAGVGCEALARRARMPAAAWATVAALAAGFGVYTAPLLIPRSITPSPPVQAAMWIRQNLPQDAILLVERDLQAHAAYLLPKHGRFPVEEGIDRYAGQPGSVYLFGETAEDGAKVFAWPDSDAYGKLTRLLYRVTAVSEVPPGRRYLAVRGVYKYERTVEGDGWRWLDAQATIRAFHMPGTRTIALTLGLPDNAPWPSSRVEISTAGAPTTAVEVHRSEKRTVVIPLSRAEIVDITFQSNESFIPVQAGLGGDARRLAVQLFDVEQRR
ncbi:MAG TPA: DUF2723 domain-containing protein [Thermoanaerobaculia bacterium]